MLDKLTGSHAAYAAFLGVVEAGSVSAAARALDQPRPTVSRRLAQLEAHLGVRLVHRGARTVVVTREGEALYERVRPLLEALREAEQAVRQTDPRPRGLLRLSLSPLMSQALAGALCDFRTRYPEVQLEVVVEGRYVDLRTERFDVAIRGGVLPDSDLVQRLLIRSSAFPVASPDYLRRRGSPETPEALTAHECLLGYDQDGQPRRVWPVRGGGTVPVSGGFVSNDRALLRIAAAAGQGIALLSEVNARSALDAGALVPVLPERVGVDISLNIVFTERAFLAPRVRCFVELIVAAFRENPPLRIL